MAQKKLYESMTQVTLILLKLNALLELIMNQTLPKEDFEKQKKEIQIFAEIEASHLAARTTLAPFVKFFFHEVTNWITDKKNGETLLHLLNVLQGNEFHTFEETLEDVNLAPIKSAPSWYLKVLEIGKTLLENKTLPLEKISEKAGTLLRNIPADTALGLMAHSFIKEFFKPNSNLTQINHWWLSLNGKIPFHYKIKIQGSYVWTEY